MENANPKCKQKKSNESLVELVPDKSTEPDL